MNFYPLGYESAVYYVQFVNYTEFRTKNILHRHSRQAAGGKHSDGTVLRHVARLSTTYTALRTIFTSHKVLTQKCIYLEKYNIKKYESNPDNIRELPTTVKSTVKKTI
jgi:hypothetical protein